MAKPNTSTNAGLDAFIAKFAALGTADGAGTGKRFEALNLFADTIKGGTSNFMNVDMHDDAWRTVVDTFAARANNAYCKAQNEAAGEIVVSEASAKTYASYFQTIGYVAVKAPDLVAPLHAAVTAYCRATQKPDRPGKRTSLTVYHRVNCEVRDTIFGVASGKAKRDASALTPADIDNAFVLKALGETKIRAPRDADKAKTETPAKTETTSETAKTETTVDMKASAVELAKRMTASEIEMDATVRMAFAVIAAWK